jgi:hypothetical protein
MENYEEKIKTATLYRYFLYAVVMRDNLKKEDIESFLKSLEDDASSVLLFFSSPIGVYLTSYYSSIYLIIEGWRDLKLSDTKIDKLISSPYTDRLRLFRNATFHYQKEPLSPKLVQFFGPKEDDTEKWINELYMEFGNYFKRNSFMIPDELLEQIKGKGVKEMVVLIQKYFLEKQK